MIYRRLNPKTGDYTFGGGFGDFLVDREAIAQMIKTRLLLFMGEWFADLNSGLPLWQGIMGYAGRNKQSVDSLIIANILGGQGVTNISNFSSKYDSSSRAYSCIAIVNTVYGQVTVGTTHTV
jgi:hypothetical protein